MKIVYSLLCAMLPLAAMADDVKITRPEALLENDTLTLNFSLDLQAVKVNGEQSYTFMPVLREGKQIHALAPVVVTGKNTRKYKMRRKERRLGKRYGFDQPYALIRGRQDDRNDLVRYTAVLPYEAWMEKASMELLQEREVCYVAPLDIQIIEPEPEVVVLPLPVDGQICEPCMNMVSYLVPEEEPLKVRSEQSTLYIEYPVGKTVFDANFKNNRVELQKLKELLAPLTEGDLVTFKSIRIVGYASPDGSARTNERVASQRAESFALYLKGGYHFPQEILNVNSAGEDWDGLIDMLESENPVYADKALAIIRKYENLDVRESHLKAALGTAAYRSMMNACYPRLRRLGIAVDYEVREVVNAEATRLIYTEPKLLSLQEMYRVAKELRPGTKEYREVYEIAADTYPDDVVANINAASANIVSGDFKKASAYMEKVKDDARAWNNLGVLSWLGGDFEGARAWFEKALTIEPEKAKENLETIKAYEPMNE